MSTVVTSSISCGVYQIYGLTYWNRSMLEERHKFADYTKKQVEEQRSVLWTKLSKGFTYTFSDADQFKNGSQLAAFIKQQNLGTITEHGPMTNPNTARAIRVWIFTYNGNKPKTLEVAA